MKTIALLFPAQSAIARSEKITQFIEAPVIDLRVESRTDKTSHIISTKVSK